MKRKLFLLLFLAAAMLTMTACNSGGGGLEGTWKMTKVESVNGDTTILEEMKGVEMEVTLSGGKMKMVRNGRTLESGYTENGDKLDFDDGSSIEFKLEGNTLILIQGNARMIFSRR